MSTFVETRGSATAEIARVGRYAVQDHPGSFMLVSIEARMRHLICE